MAFAKPAEGIEAIFNEGFSNLYPTGNAAQWCSQYHQLASELSSAAGTITFDEYQKALLSVIGDQSTPERLVLLKSSRVGATTLVNALSCYGVAHNRNVLIYQANGDEAKLYAKESIESSLRENAVTREYLKNIEKSSWLVGNYIANGSVIRVRGANASSSYRRVDSSFCFMDELSSYNRQNLGSTNDKQGEGDIVQLAERAVRIDASPKLVLLSSPVAQEECAIFRHFMLAPMRFAFNVICPNHSCGAPIALRWSNFRFKGPKYSIEQRAASVRYQCQVCRKSFKQDKLDVAMRDGFFVVEKYPLWYESDSEDEVEPDKETEPYWGWSIEAPEEDPPYLINVEGKRVDWPTNSIGFFVNSFLNRRYRWEKIVSEFLSAKDDELLLRAFSQQTRGVPFVSKRGKINETTLDKCRIPVDPNQLLNQYKFVVAAIDVQINYLSCSVYAWDSQYNILVLDCMEFLGETDREGAQAWNGLVTWLNSKPKWKRQDGTELPIDCVVIDVGYLSNVVFGMFKYLLAPARLCCRGVGTTNRTPMVARAPRGRGTYGNVPVIHISDTETKDLISDYFGRDKIRINSAISPNDYLQFASEKRIRFKNQFGSMQSKWVKLASQVRNERFDEIRMALGAVIALNVGWSSFRLTPEEKAGIEKKGADERASAAARQFAQTHNVDEFGGTPKPNLFNT